MGWKMKDLPSFHASPIPSSSLRPQMNFSIRTSSYALSFMLCIFSLIYTLFHFYPPSQPAFTLTSTQLTRLHTGLQKCNSFTHQPYWERSRAPRNVNPRFRHSDSAPDIVVLKNVTLYDGESWLPEAVDVVLRQGLVAEVTETGRHLWETEDDISRVHNMWGLHVTPGLIDMHSHSTVDSYPYLRATADVNEVVNPMTPWARTIDAINPHDPAINIIASGGVTTSLILPGSANIIGGEAYAIKNSPAPKNAVSDLLIEPENLPKRIRWAKMACGENPKRVYPSKTNSRMGLGHALRAHLASAKQLRERQDQWCSLASNPATANSELVMRGLPEDMDYDLTLGILRGDVRVNIHCYETMDMENMLRYADEYGWRVEAFHHALDAWRIPEMLKREDHNVTVATFAELAYYKKEAYQASLWAGKILSEAGLPIVYKSDHPVTNAKYLLSQAATAHGFQLSADLALAAVTSTPAKALGLDDRIGYIRTGYDADLVVWDSHPLSVGATPIQVYIDGKPLFDGKREEESKTHIVMKEQSKASKPRMRSDTDEKLKREFCSSIQREDEITVIKGIVKSLLPSGILPFETLLPSNESLVLVLKNKKPLCLNVESVCLELHPTTATSKILTLSNGHLLPGLTALSVGIGLSEIEAEKATQDGVVSPFSDPLNEASIIYAKYGLHFGGKLIARAKSGGVTKIVTPPLHAGGLLQGVSVGFRTTARNILENNAIFEENVALHFVVGQSGKSSLNPTISSQLQDLRKLFLDNKSDLKANSTLFSQAASGDIPVVVKANNKDDIAQVIKIKNEFPSVKLVIYGGIESWGVADELAAANLPVILAPWRCEPGEWEYRHCLTGPPISKSIVEVLYNAGVKFGLAVTDDAFVRDLFLEAAWAAKYIGFPTVQDEEAFAVKLATVEVKKILRLNEAPGAGDFVVWEGNPLQHGASVVVIVGQGNVDSGEEGCWPDVE